MTPPQLVLLSLKFLPSLINLRLLLQSIQQVSEQKKVSGNRASCACRFPQAMSRALDMHDKLLREMLKKHFGYEVGAGDMWVRCEKFVSETSIIPHD